MGNLRSVAKALRHVAPEARGASSPPTRRRSAPPTASCCPARARCPTACASCASPACATRCSRPRATKPLLGVCVGMQMLFERSEEGDTPGLGLLPGEVVRFQLDGRLQPTAAASRCRRWAGTEVRQARPHPLWAGHRRRQPLLFRAQLLRRAGATRATAPATPMYGAPLYLRASRAIIFSPPSSTPRKAQPPACDFYSQLRALERPDAPSPRLASPHHLAMLLIPAIDLKDGHCVRLKQGDMDAGHRVLRRPGGDGAGTGWRRARGACTWST